ncbi:MAG: aminopeptidase [Streptococcaceae bacterium]|jgi:aminopeptidase|nr:aminopeptidase [Streptococcaceae bacterium]
MVLADFDKYLKKYARLIAEMGVNAQLNHLVFLNVQIDQARLAHLIVEELYSLGVAEVIVDYKDDVVDLARYLHADEKRLTTVPDSYTQRLKEFVDLKVSRISINSSDPAIFKSADSERIVKRLAAFNAASFDYATAIQSNKMSWTVAAAASYSWAAKVFPDLPTKEEQLDALWEQIFKTTRIYEDDPVKAWQEHNEKLCKQAQKLNTAQFYALHYTAPGTDLTIGLPKNHYWEGAGATNAQGEFFIANMPTEEVFTAPDRNRVDGLISSTKPLSYAGIIVSGMKFTFKDGKVVDFSAEQGQDVLEKLMATDDGARYLGEVALVPDPSPISQSGITFFNTLFDENASNHLALGQAYATSLVGGERMSQEELKASGLNRSEIHVDFMVGSEQMDIDGIKKDGTHVPVFRGGDWAE